MALISLTASSAEPNYWNNKVLITNQVNAADKASMTVSKNFNYSSGTEEVLETTSADIFQSVTQQNNPATVPWQLNYKVGINMSGYVDIVYNDKFNVCSMSGSGITEADYLDNVYATDLIITNPKFISGKRYNIYKYNQLTGDIDKRTVVASSLFVSLSAAPNDITIWSNNNLGLSYAKTLGLNGSTNSLIVFSEYNKPFPTSDSDTTGSGYFVYCGGTVKTVTSADIISRVNVGFMYKIKPSVYESLKVIYG